MAVHIFINFKKTQCWDGPGFTSMHPGIERMLALFLALITG